MREQVRSVERPSEEQRDERLDRLVMLRFPRLNSPEPLQLPFEVDSATFELLDTAPHCFDIGMEIICEQRNLLLRN